MTSTTVYEITDERISPEPDQVTSQGLRAYLASMNDLNDWGIDVDTLDCGPDVATVVLDGERTEIARRLA